MNKKLFGTLCITWTLAMFSVHIINGLSWLFIGLYNYDRGSFSLFLFCLALTVILLVATDFIKKKTTAYNTALLAINFLIGTGILFLLCTEEWAWVLLFVRLIGAGFIKLGVSIIGQSSYKDLSFKELFS